jgi:hypothetical protein
MYDRGRYFALTGHRLDGTPAEVMERGELLAELHAELLGRQQTPRGHKQQEDRALALDALAGLSKQRAVGYFDWLGVGMALHSVDSSEAMLAAWDRWSQSCQEKHTEGVCAAKWATFTAGGIGLGSLIHWARQDGWEPERTAERNGAGHGPSPANAGGDGASTASRPATEKDQQGSTQKEGPPPAPLTPQWPDPPGREALHGLAGEIVKAIEPHSEADPVALLVQVLTGVGNSLGRTTHFVAEGAAHHLNEYAALVGVTAKGRKGSSWGRVKPVLETADGNWASQRIQSGLSSGEGLIWAVRDPSWVGRRLRRKAS